MKTLGLIGGTSWYSTIKYYEGLNLLCNQRYDNNTNPPLIIYNADQHRIHQWQEEDKWDDILAYYIEIGSSLIAAGAQGLSFCANTPHYVYDQLVANVSVPVLHIADATAAALNNMKVHCPVLIGTRFTMTKGFMKEKLSAHGVDAVVPDAGAVQYLHRLITQKLVVGKFDKEDVDKVLQILREVTERDGTDSVILGCTEFGLLLKDVNMAVPVVDTVEAHVSYLDKFIHGDL